MHTHLTTRPAATRVPALLAIVLLLAAITGTAHAHGPDDGPDEHLTTRGQALGRIDPGIGAELARARAATARYHDVEVAIADGYVLASDCVAGPAGAMGYHYVNLGMFVVPPDGPPTLAAPMDARAPQALLYVPDANDRLRLVGAEYINPAGDELFGQPFADGTPLFGPNTALHVWLWQANPAGMFAPFHAGLRCPAAD
jgi:hypothetical protein